LLENRLTGRSPGLGLPSEVPSVTSELSLLFDKRFSPFRLSIRLQIRKDLFPEPESLILRASPFQTRVFFLWRDA